MHKTLVLASTLLLAACDQPDITDLSTLAIPGVKPINYRAHDPAYFLTLPHPPQLPRLRCAKQLTQYAACR